jgi:hypothetical protein
MQQSFPDVASCHLYMYQALHSNSDGLGCWAMDAGLVHCRNTLFFRPIDYAIQFW